MLLILELTWEQTMSRNIEDIIRERFGSKIYLTVAEISELTGIPRQTIRNRMSQGRWSIPWERFGRRVLTKVTVFVTAVSDGVFCNESVRRRGRPRKRSVPSVIEPLTPIM